MVLLVCALLGSADSVGLAQSPQTAPLPVSPAARTRLFQKQQDKQKTQPEPKPQSPIPPTRGVKPLAQQPAPVIPPGPVDPVLAQVKQAIELNKRRFLDPSQGHTPWMIMHGVLALRKEYELKIGGKSVNAIDYITQQNPYYSGTLPVNPNNAGSSFLHAQGHWFQSTAYGGRAQPYIVSFAFEGHINQFLAILSVADLPLTQTFVVADSQRPGATKTITMADMVRHAQMNVHAGDSNEVAWTLWFLSNYLAPDEKWVNKDGNPWSMEQLVTIQTNAPLFNPEKLLAPCGGTHGLFALACACNSYEKKFGKLDGAWFTARMKLDERIAQAKAMQNGDGSFSTEYFKNSGWSAEMGPRFKSSGHMLEWLMLALPPEELKQQWVQAGVMSVANDLVGNGNVDIVDTATTGAMYHALHALVLYRNRIDPPASPVPPERVAEVPPEMKHPAPGTTPPPPLLVPMSPNPVPPNPDQGTGPQPPAENKPQATIRLINPATNKLSPLGTVRPILRPITNSKETETRPQLDERPVPPPLAEKIGEPKSGEPARIPLFVPTKPLLEKPASTPLPGEPKSEGALVVPLTQDEGDTTPAPLFGPEPANMTPRTPAPGEPSPSPTPGEGQTPVPSASLEDPDAEKPVAEALLVPALPEPTPAKSPSTSD